MSKDRLLHFYLQPDLDGSRINLSSHSSIVADTGIIKEDPYPFPLGRIPETFKQVIVISRETPEIRILYRRIS